MAENRPRALIGQLRIAGDLDLPLLPRLPHPNRWLLWLGLLFILAIYWAPTGIVGKLRERFEKAA